VWWLTQHCRWSFLTEDRIQSDTLHKRTEGWIGWPQFLNERTQGFNDSHQAPLSSTDFNIARWALHLTAQNVSRYIHLNISQQCILCESTEHGRLQTYSWVRHSLSNACTNIQFVDTIRIIIKCLKIFKIAPTCSRSQGIHHHAALYSNGNYCNFSQALYKTPWWWIPCDPKHAGAF